MISWKREVLLNDHKSLALLQLPHMFLSINHMELRSSTLARSGELSLRESRLALRLLILSTSHPTTRFSGVLGVMME
jgi:hypothetical protein